MYEEAGMDNKMFGFGCMRLPILEEGKPDTFDYDTIEKLFDTFLEQGFSYFDTALYIPRL